MTQVPVMTLFTQIDVVLISIKNPHVCAVSLCPLWSLQKAMGINSRREYSSAGRGRGHRGDDERRKNLRPRTEAPCRVLVPNSSV
ncbi:hypothetical protein EVAR_12411_1 [Eumeta japonica]|uniref:Uncharacterized protein n=1 Tax=Eumeta variegata TaxID=151549 RepID=A0A4C1TZF6_EUMVA|nr:hypothetical protein EVAR_12411_1 [Eumeta japonica]